MVDPPSVDGYLDRWRSRFDLFDPVYPFFQVVEELEPKAPVSRLRHELASGNNTTLFDHTSDGQPPAFTAAEAARSLVATQAFALGGGVSKPFNLCDAPLTRGFTVMARGTSLFETLLLNLLPYSAESPVPTSADMPTWERDSPAIPDKNGTAPRGYLDYLTWQSRAVRLAPRPDGTVTHCSIHQHLRLPNGFHSDPFVVYRQDDKRGWLPRRLQAERSLWRDSEAILTDNLARSASVLDWLRQLTAMHSRRSHRLTLVGIGSPGQAKIEFWRSETLPLPDRYLSDTDLRTLLKGALATAEEVARELRSAVRSLAHELGVGGDANAGFLRAQRTDERYWPRLEPPFHLLLGPLATAWDSGDPDEATGPLDAWRETVVATALTALEEITSAYDTTARELRAAALARRHGRFIRALGTVREPEASAA
jgi:CRISPR system Cascade subunit CasA